VVVVVVVVVVATHGLVGALPDRTGGRDVVPRTSRC
jgi:hypothetical protein